MTPQELLELPNGEEFWGVGYQGQLIRYVKLCNAGKHRLKVETEHTKPYTTLPIEEWRDVVFRTKQEAEVMIVAARLSGARYPLDYIRSIQLQKCV